MSLNETPSANRIHIGFFGRRNAGKSSLVNAVTGQNIAVVSDIAGTTTDPVNKSMELLPLGPVVITDTAGFDDEGVLGVLRIEKTKEVLKKTDIAVLVVDISEGLTDCDRELLELFKEKNINYIIAYNKCELTDTIADLKENEIAVSALKKINITELKNMLANIKPKESSDYMVSGFVNPGDTVVFVTPIDESAPKGRLILPQQMAIRDCLDCGAVSVVTQPEQLSGVLTSLKDKPKLVVTDSQVFNKVKDIVPEDIMLTSFSILMARVKGLLESAVDGAIVLDTLKNGDTVLVSEACTHHRQCNDIGTVKLPHWLENYTKKKLNFEFTSGGAFPDELGKYALIVHCGGCMINEKQMTERIKCAKEQNIPITNYGTVIAHINGILKRSLEIIPHLYNKL